MVFTPSVPVPPEAPLPVRDFLRAIRTNAIGMYPRDAYQRDRTVRDFAGRKNVLLNAPEDIHHVLVGHPERYRRSPASIRVLRPITGYGLLLSEGDDWKLQRRTIAPALAPRVMPMLARHIVTSTQQALARLEAEAGQPIDLLAATQTLALDIAARSMFSMEMDRYGAPIRRFMTEFAGKHARPRLLDMMLPASVPSPADLGRWWFKRRWMGFVETMLAERLKEAPPDTPRDLFDLLRAARDPETGEGFSPDELRDQVATMILAGHETTAVTLFWAILLLAEAPDQQAWLAEETGAVAIGPDNAVPGMAGLVRTKAVVNEALRLFPPAFTVVRETKGTDRIGDLELPPGSVVMIAPWVLHRHAKNWDNPAEFRPARFMPDQPAPGRFAFMPFGAGPRICVGAQFALTEAILVLAALTGRFSVTRVDSRPVLPVGVVTTQPDHPARVRLAPR